MTIDFKFIEHWEPKYDEIESDEEEYLSLIERVKDETTTLSSIRPETFERIMNWKSPRAKGTIKWEDYDIYRDAFKNVLEPKNPDKMTFLTNLPGIGAPVASTILHFIFPQIFPIYDFRTVEVLNSFCYLKSKAVSPKRYPEFQKAILKIRTEVVHHSLRQIDRALFAYHKIHLSPKRKSTAERKEVGRRMTMPRAQDEAKIKDKVLSIFKKNRVGEKFGREEIIDLVVNTYPGTNRGSVVPPDYCYNKINKDPASFNLHLFESLGAGRFKCLGQNYPYSGPIYWKGEQVGKWDKGKYQLWKDPRK